MDNMIGAKLITSAYVFGTASFVFTTMPFVIVLMYGFKKNRENHGGGILGILFNSFFIHTFSTLCFMALILILDKLNFNNSYYQDTIFPIFWAESKENVFSLSNATDSTEADLAYSVLFLTQTIIKLFYMFVPIIVFSISFVYGVYLAKKDTYRTDYISVVAYTLISTIIASTLYIFWALIATEGLFLPSGVTLMEYITTIWQSQLN